MSADLYWLGLVPGSALICWLITAKPWRKPAELPDEDEERDWQWPRSDRSESPPTASDDQRVL